MLEGVQKLIVVTGTGNTGKTSSIKQALEKLHIIINPDYPSRDVVFIGRVLVDGREMFCGFASGGDSAEIVEGNLRAFSETGLALQAIILACKSYGGSRDAIENFAELSGLSPYWISTIWVSDHAARASEIDRVSDEIIECLRSSD
jgi:hypothetical protein